MNKLAVKVGVALLGLLISYFGIKKGRKLYKDFKNSGKTMDEIKKDIKDITDLEQEKMDKTMKKEFENENGKTTITKVNLEDLEKVKECEVHSDSMTNKEALDLADKMIADKLEKEEA